MRFLSAVLLAVSAVFAEVVELTDDNFVGTTKIGTGEQTERWFVKFFAPWCPHCKRMAQTWVDLSEELGEGPDGTALRVGEVDATTQDALKTKFDITGFPRMYLFDTDGKVYKYPGARTVEGFSAFALGGYKSFDPVATTL
ncbi:thioredoxin domain protein [Gregarina niphandrodes]|uniref:Thioredoxin domain protein n=1 Tax=Gregarina niphandrodes TaxID=110365 RepID=A0A023AZU8_GRENI|nr:thioredoxin domain protein [Gregarina niphandrodes]EZG44097.1 thioredoxin domain protein [Gregarina niphandrodes]|eukprot:XP_011132808.1 thioredoxin domain protein [Gregarina niphandrodes]